MLEFKIADKVSKRVEIDRKEFSLNELDNNNYKIEAQEQRSFINDKSPDAKNEIIQIIFNLTGSKFDKDFLKRIDETNVKSCRYDIQELSFKSMNSLIYDHYLNIHAIMNSDYGNNLSGFLNNYNYP